MKIYRVYRVDWLTERLVNGNDEWDAMHRFAKHEGYDTVSNPVPNWYLLKSTKNPAGHVFGITETFVIS